ncbi:MAG: hypothetical protein AB2556_25070 [Candidatus Thiodiazotropha sp.]
MKERTHDINDIEVADGIYARAGPLALDACMIEERAARLLDSLPEGEFILKLKFLREQNKGNWMVEDKFVPARVERRRGQAIIEISRGTRPALNLSLQLPTASTQSGPDPANLTPQLCGPESCGVL